jgi:hypothetical protein
MLPHVNMESLKSGTCKCGSFQTLHIYICHPSDYIFTCVSFQILHIYMLQTSDSTYLHVSALRICIFTCVGLQTLHIYMCHPYKMKGLDLLVFASIP